MYIFASGINYDIPKLASGGDWCVYVLDEIVKDKTRSGSILMPGFSGC